MNPTNERSISLLTSFSKVFEKSLYIKQNIFYMWSDHCSCSPSLQNLQGHSRLGLLEQQRPRPSDLVYWRDLPGHRHSKLFIGGLCKKRADDLRKLSRHQLKIVVVILTGHAPVRKQLCNMGLFEGDPTCRFCRKEAEIAQHIICRCEALARQRYNVFGYPFVEPKDISTASVRNLCLFIRGTGLLNLCLMQCFEFYLLTIPVY
jgi:hypothetical protein